MLCYVATTYGNKTTASVEDEIMAYQNVRDGEPRGLFVARTRSVAVESNQCRLLFALHGMSNSLRYQRVPLIVA